MRNFKNFILIFITSILINSCVEKKNVTLGFLIPASEGSRWVIDQRYVEEAAEDLNTQVITRSAENDENKQLKQAKELLELGVDVLIVVPVNSNTAAAIVREAHRYNVKVVGYARLIRNSDLDYLVAYDGARIGEMMVEYCIEKVPKGNYVFLWGDAGDENAVLIKEAQEKVLKPYVESGDINVVYKGYVDNWEANNAYHLMNRVLSFSDQKIDVVVNSNDDLAMGVLRALKEIPDISVQELTGQDATIEAIKSIVKDELSLTIYKSYKRIATAATKLAVDLARNEIINDATSFTNNGRYDVPTLKLESQRVDKNSIRSTVIADGLYTEEEVYGE
jgi:D-xylose transport system substrate-binding protein